VDITAAVLHGTDQPFQIEHVELESPRAREVLVRVVATGICHSDLAVRAGDLPLPTPVILGHEGSGIVEAVGDGVAKVVPGDHVVMSFAFCGACVPCQSGHPVYCVNSAAMNLSGTRADGSTAYRRDGETLYGHFVGQSSFATHALVHDSAVVKVPADLPLELLSPLGCGVQTGAGTVMNVLRPQYGSSLAVTGSGTVGLSAIMAARVVGCSTIVAVDVHESRLRLAEELGATHTILSGDGDGDGDLAGQLRAATGGHGVDFCVDTTGLQAVMAAGYGALAVRGTLSLVGVSPAGNRIDLHPWSILVGRTVSGNMEGDVVPDRFIPYLLDLHEQGRFPFDRLVTQCGGLADINDAVEAIERGDVVKAVLAVG
jgi:aryl-alcohol dehydrogenase